MKIEYSPPLAEEVKQTTCYMCACRCGIDVHINNNRVSYIQGNRNHPVNRGVLCAKGSAGMLHLESPSRLNSPLLRIGERGEGKFKPIDWDEALGLATSWLSAIRETDPRKLAFFTGRDQSQALTGWWAQQFGTPNYASHGGFCSVNMAAAGIYSIGGSFWEFTQPDWKRTKLFLLFGVAEDHDSNPIKLGLTELRRNGAKIISINPVRTGYSAIADTWIGINPGTDGLLILSVIGEILRHGSVDIDSLRYRTDATWLVNTTSGDKNGLFIRNEAGEPMIFDANSETIHSHLDQNTKPLLNKSITLKDGSTAKTVFKLAVEKYLEPQYHPKKVSEITGIKASVIQGLARQIHDAAFNQSEQVSCDWTDIYGNHHTTIDSRPVAIHAMRGISAHSNGFQTCRALHLLQILIGAIDSPGGTRFKPPYPKPYDIHLPPAKFVNAHQPLRGMPLGYPQGPEDLLVDKNGDPQRIDKAFSWEAPLSVHGKMHSVISNAAAKDPYAIEVLFLYMANMAWNSSMNTKTAMKDLSAKDSNGQYKIPKIIVSDAFASEMTAFADLVLPDTTYFERYDCISILDRPIGEPDLVADAIRHPVINCERNVRPFQDVLITLGASLKLPGFVTEEGNQKYDNYPHYLVTHERKKDIGPLAGWRGADGNQSGRGNPNPEQLNHYVTNNSVWTEKIPEQAQYFKYVNRDYQNWAVKMGFFDQPYPFKLSIYSEVVRKFQLAAEGFGTKQPPKKLRNRISKHFDPLPFWYPTSEQEIDKSFPYTAITQRPMAMYHSWGSQNPWLRQIHSQNKLFVPQEICKELNLVEGDWVWLESHIGKICVPIQPMKAVNQKTLWTWNAIGKRSGAWRLGSNSPEVSKGFLLNHLISELLPKQEDGLRWSNSDPVTGQAAWYDLKVKITKAKSDENKIFPEFSLQLEPPNLDSKPPNLRYEVRSSQ